MNAGSTITSRDIHEVRHISTARQARDFRPRCRNDAPSPATSSTSANAIDALRKPAFIGTAASTASASATISPCAVPASVVKKRIEKAGCIESSS